MKYRERGLPKKGGPYLRGLGKKEGVVFLRGVDTPMPTTTIVKWD